MERPIQNIFEVFPEGIVARKQFFAELKTIAISPEPLTCLEIVGKHEELMMMLWCEETGRPANEAEVAADLLKLKGLGILQRSNEGKYSLTSFGMDLFVKAEIAEQERSMDD